MNKSKKKSNFDSSVMSFIKRLQTLLNKSGSTIITFISARPSEGVTTLVNSSAEATSIQSDKKILIIDAGNSTKRKSREESNHNFGLVDCIISGQNILSAIITKDSGVDYIKWVGNADNKPLSSKKIADSEVWKTLTAHYNVILIDAPALQVSYDGVLFAAKSSTTVIVVEAEKTPAGVIINLKNSLLEAGANIAGIVMNKRRYYIPSRVYNKL